jgi:hypothetical protein
VQHVHGPNDRNAGQSTLSFRPSQWLLYVAKLIFDLNHCGTPNVARKVACGPKMGDLQPKVQEQMIGTT